MCQTGLVLLLSGVGQMTQVGDLKVVRLTADQYIGRTIDAQQQPWWLVITHSDWPSVVKQTRLNHECRETCIDRNKQKKYCK